MREQFLAQLPDGLRPDALARWKHVWHSADVDEAQYLLLDVEPGPDGCALLRQSWVFDEEDLEWVLESNDEWWLPWAASEAVMQGLIAAMEIGEAK